MTKVIKGIDSRWVVLALSLVLLVVPMFALGQGFGGETPEAVITDVAGFWALLDTLFTIMYSLFFALAAFFILYSGFLYLTAGGDEEKMGKAKSVLVYALIAVVIAVVSLGLAQVVANIVTGA